MSTMERLERIAGNRADWMMLVPTDARALLAVVRAAQVVGSTDWRSSVSETEHHTRIDKVDELRAALAVLEAK